MFLRVYDSDGFLFHHETDTIQTSKVRPMDVWGFKSLRSKQTHCSSLVPIPRFVWPTIKMTDAKSFPVTEAQLTALFLQSIFYGILLVTFGFSTRALFTYRGRLKRSKEINWLVVVVTFISLCIASLDLSLVYYGNMRAFVFYQGKGGPTAEFTRISSWINITKVRIFIKKLFLKFNQL